MTATLDTRARMIIDEVVDLDCAARAEFLDRACAGECELRRRVESLLASMAKEDVFLSEPTFGAASAAAGPRLGERAGSSVGPYRLVQLIGEGGFGSVFLAEQNEPVRRSVALKIIKLGMDTHQVVARFEQERQALALMDHPNIAKVLDGGATEKGRPYFVMELVKGEPITSYCDTAKLSIPERLDLFMQVCRAVQHAHTKGIIHRDIKPTNVLVSAQDDRPHCKIIDFGIAKATSPGAPGLTDKTVFTEFRQLIGTPVYMSPEQAAGSLDVDTRTDVYSLGVLLYELLTGTTPFDARKLIESGRDGFLRTLREQDPPRPSLRLATLAASSSSVMGLNTPSLSQSASSDSSVIEIARRRQSEPSPLTRLIRGDLDWIVMRALDKDRARRYASPGDFAADIERYRAGEPIEAKRDALAYVWRKRLRRHWVAATVTAGFILLLAGGLVVSITLWQAAARALLEKEQQRKLADQRAEDTQRVAGFQAQMLSKINLDAMGTGIKQLFREQVRASLERQSIGRGLDRRKRSPDEVAAELSRFDEITEGALPIDVARHVLARYVLRDAAEAATAKFADQPRVEAELLYTVGDTCTGLGLYDEAEPHLRRALKLRRQEYGERSQPVGECLGKLAALLKDKGKPAAAESMTRKALDIYRELRGAQSVDVANGLVSLAENRSQQGDLAEAEKLLREALAMFRSLQGDESPEIASALNALACTLQSKGEYASAEPLFEQSVSLSQKFNGDDSYTTAHYMQNFAVLLNSRRDWARAEPMFRDALDRLRKTVGADDPEYATTSLNLAVVLNSQQEFAEAEPIYREALAEFRKLYGDEDLHVASAIEGLALVYRRQGQMDEAEPLLREALALNRKLFGDQDRRVAVSLTQLGVLMAHKSDYDQAASLYREALAIFEQLLGDSHPDVGTVRLNLGRVLYFKGDFATAEPLFRAALEVFLHKRRASDDETVDGRICLGRAIIKLVQQPLHDSKQLNQSAPPGEAIRAQLQEAEALLLAAETVYRTKPDAPQRHYPTLCDALIELYNTWQQLAPGEGYDGRAAEWREKLATWRASTQPATLPGQDDKPGRN